MRIPTNFKLMSVLLAAGGLSLLSAQTVTVDHSTLSFSAQFQGTKVPLQLTVSSPTPGVQFSVFVNSSSPATPSQWLKVNDQIAVTLATNATVTVTADPAGLNPGKYTSSLSVFGAGSSTPIVVQVTFQISTIGVNPFSVTFAPYVSGTSTFPAQQSITLTGTAPQFTASATTQTGGAWLNVIPLSGNLPGAVTASVNPGIVAGLAVNTYTGTITITPVGSADNTPLNLPVTLQVLPSPQVSVNPTSLVFNVQNPANGGTNNTLTKTFQIAISPAQSLNYATQASTDSGGNWITSVNPPSANTDGTTGTANVSVTVSPAGLTPGTTYTGRVNVFAAGGTPNSTPVPITFNYSNNQLLDVPNNTLNFAYQLGGTTPAAKSVTVTATSGTQAFAIAQSSGSTWLSVPNAGSTAAPFAVSVNPAGLTPGTYNATISVTSATPGSTAQQIPVVLKVTNDPVVTTNVDAMGFPFQIGQQAPASQTLKIGSSTGVPLNYTATVSTSTCGNNWLLLNGATTAVSGPTEGTLAVSVSTVGQTTPGPCTGSITVAATIASTGATAVNSPKVIPITLTVSNTPLLVAAPASLSFSVPAGGPSPAPQSIALSSTSAAAGDVLNYTLTGVSQGNAPSTWLSASPTQGTTASGNIVSVFVFSSNLPAGTYNGSVTLAATTSSAAAVANSPVTIPVTLQVTSGSLTLSSTQLNFTYTLGGSSPATQTVTVGSTNQSLVFTAVATSTSQNPWLSVTPTSGNTNGGGTLTVAVDGTKLTTPGTFNGSITVTSPGAGNSPATINVAVVVSPGTISAPTTTLSFTQVAGGTAPAAQTVAVTGSPSALAFTVATATTPSGGTWLSASPASGNTPGNISVSANGAGLSVGQYTGQVIITSTGANGSPITVPVVLNVIAPASVTTVPTSLTFTYTTGLTVPNSQPLQVNSTTAVPITASVQVTGPASWLFVTPTTSTAPAMLTVSVQPTALPAGTYTGTITITSPNLLTGVTVGVTLTVIAIPKPVIAAVDNAGSYSNGPISPGENIVIFGTGIGPAVLAQNGLTNGAFGTTVGLTRVLFDGIPAPMIYASATQTSAMVPYGLFGRTTTNVVVEYSGVQSNPITYNVVSAAPGIYTLNQQGTGPGAILNQDGFTVNSANTPEKRGNVISVYMTGEGQTTPSGVDGFIIPPVLSALKNPILPVTATIGGVNATVVYAGSAASLVSGVMQVNILIPATAPVGASVPIVVTVGTTNSQAAVTVAVQ